ncbi:MBL fold hydrolase [Candidatus Nomurabacteria bacterium CG10_big_fil_rev_8_21_14_0_10_35_16]|uniref:MBL fold hydrolase n=1 Tax=Candidatus Nomurabacteria bacterium CG10_big_fil_rev_8_21_14_0_10_35_16 TaxID=1974731 RepID=A0A2H0TBE0_9BACT|nr:MAG: MBL fold hydrolase [Candidatus Nomurabacteria bacterium CG10_big_fil_rev_8_21_14_0_10_35_16]
MKNYASSRAQRGRVAYRTSSRFIYSQVQKRKINDIKTNCLANRFYKKAQIKKMKLNFFGGAGMVTGANYMLEVGSIKFLVECGMIQGEQHTDQLNAADFPYNPEEIDFVLITHAHLDHIGRLPKLIRNGFSGKIYATAPTKDLMPFILEDAYKIASEEAKHYPKRIHFDMDDVNKVSEYSESVPYNKEFSPAENVKVTFRDAGHILGSAIIEVQLEENGKTVKIVFSGDLGNSPTLLLNPITMIKEADYVLVESAYGDRVHEDKKNRQHLLEDVIESTVTDGGVLLIPSFALERTQELLYEINKLVENKRIPPTPVYIDGPLSLHATDVYKKHQSYFNKETTAVIQSGDDIFQFQGLKLARTPEESKAINDIKPPKIIIAGSGMSQGGRILHHELRYLPDPRNTILFITYQVRGTRGRKIMEGMPSVHIFGQEVPVKLQVKTLAGYSAHADQVGLLKWIDNFQRPVKKVFVVQGEQNASEALKNLIQDKLGIPAEVSTLGEAIEL